MSVSRLRHAAALVVAGVVTAVVASGLTACGDDEPDGSAAGDKIITVYSGRNELLVKPVLDDFQKASGITVKTRYGDTAGLAAQLLEEGDRTRADLFLAQDAGALGAVTKRGMFAALPTEVLDRVPPQYRARGGEWVGVTGRSRVLVYNTDQVPAADLPKSVAELTGSKWKGRVGVAPTNGSFQAFVTAYRVQHGDEKAKDFLTGLKANDAQIRESNPLIVADVNTGKLAAGLVNHYYVYQRAKEDGTTVDALKAKLHFFPGGDVGGLVNVSGIGVLKRAATDPDVRALVDYLLGTEAQTFFAQSSYEYPLVSGVPTAPGLPALTSLEMPVINLNDLDTLEATVKMIKDSGLA
jgi:iron(III) transport system substrate-binding protein